MTRSANGSKCNDKIRFQNNICELYRKGHIKITRSIFSDDHLYLYAHSTRSYGICPQCGKHSKTVRSHYVRKLMDLPVAQYGVSVLMLSRRFRCNNPSCPVQIFSEQYPGYILPYARKTLQATACLEKILIEMSARKGSVIAGIIHLPESVSTCLRIVESLSIPDCRDIEVVGIDDWAKRKGINYGTILVDAKTGHPVDLIDSRGNADVIKWLSRHPHIQYVTRDRASSYAKAITEALPESIQIADKFHLVKNLGDYIYEEIQRQYREIKRTFLSREKAEAESHPPAKEPTTPDKPVYPGPVVSHRRQELFDQIHRLSRAGLSQRKIVKVLNVGRNTVRYYLAMDGLQPKRIVFTNNYEDYLVEIKQGCTKGLNIRDIFRSITGSGFRGKLTAFYHWFHLYFPGYESKQDQKELPPVTVEDKETLRFGALSPRKLAVYVENPEWRISKITGECSRENRFAQKVIASCDLLQNLRHVSQSFRRIINGDNQSALNTWLFEVKQLNIKTINSFVKGVNQDKEAVLNAIRYPWTNGLVEGNVNRLKNKKREMYGRAGFELLRRKTVLSKTG
jgi:transposase